MFSIIHNYQQNSSRHNLYKIEVSKTKPTPRVLELDSANRSDVSTTSIQKLRLSLFVSIIHVVFLSTMPSTNELLQINDMAPRTIWQMC